MAGQIANLAAHLLRPRVSIGVRLLAFDAAGQVFLVRHSYTPGWHLPGGGVERGETPRAAAIREGREEGGLSLLGPPELFHVYLRRATGIDDHVLVFLARGAAADPGWRASAEILAAGFHPPDALPDATTPATRARVAEALGRATPADHW